MTTELIFAPNGDVRGLWSDHIDLRRVGLMPARASRVEVILEGPHRGLFHVDFTPLAELTSNPTLAVCLTSPFTSHDAAVQAEQRWLHHAFIMPPVADEPGKD